MSAIVIPHERIENKIYLIRGMKVMIDRDLAELYGVSTSQLNRQVRRNIARFPNDFMIQITRQEFNALICHFGTSKKGGVRKLSLVLTEQGIAMLSGVLNSPRAIEVNIAIMRAFIKLRELMITHKDLARKIKELEEKFNKHDENFVIVFQAIKKIPQAPREQRKKKPLIGFSVK